MLVATSSNVESGATYETNREMRFIVGTIDNPSGNAHAYSAETALERTQSPAWRWDLAREFGL